jgi:hypothetical protein
MNLVASLRIVLEIRLEYAWNMLGNSVPDRTITYTDGAWTLPNKGKATSGVILSLTRGLGLKDVC